MRLKSILLAWFLALPYRSSCWIECVCLCLLHIFLHIKKVDSSITFSEFASYEEAGCTFCYRTFGHDRCSRMRLSQRKTHSTTIIRGEKKVSEKLFMCSSLYSLLLPLLLAIKVMTIYGAIVSVHYFFFFSSII